MLSVYLPQLETLSFIKCQLIVSLSSICLSIVHQLTLLIIIALKEDKNEKSVAIDIDITPVLLHWLAAAR